MGEGEVALGALGGGRHGLDELFESWSGRREACVRVSESEVGRDVEAGDEDEGERCRRALRASARVRGGAESCMEGPGSTGAAAVVVDVDEAPALRSSSSSSSSPCSLLVARQAGSRLLARSAASQLARRLKASMRTRPPRCASKLRALPLLLLALPPPPEHRLPQRCLAALAKLRRLCSRHVTAALG